VVRKGQTVSFTATVRATSGAGKPTGTVSFLVGRTSLAQVRINSAGKAHFSHRFATKGQFVIQAIYSGDTKFAASAQSITVRVTTLGSHLNVNDVRNRSVNG
jgi:hypothetical protein